MSPKLYESLHIWNTESTPAILAVHVAKLLPKKRAGIERRHAPNVTHTVVRRTNVPKVV